MRAIADHLERVFPDYEGSAVVQAPRLPRSSSLNGWACTARPISPGAVKQVASLPVID